MGEINLLDLYPKAKRDIEGRQKAKEEDKVLARQFGREYFDGTRDQGYGGYKYDGRWKPIIQRFKDYYKLPDDAAILDVGCAKGFMLHDFLEIMPQAKVTGIDISEYGIANSMDSVKMFLQIGNANKLPFADNSFDLVIGINVIHNLDRNECFEAVKEIERVGRGGKFITVDAYHNEAEKKRMKMWNLTAQTVMHVDDWKEFFDQAGYTGNYYWFIP